MARTAQEIVASEVFLCLSHLVSIVGRTISAQHCGRELSDFCEQASDLQRPIADWEEAAVQAGWEKQDTGPEGQSVFRDTTDGQTWCAKDWEALCGDHDIEPYDREVFEHWAISDWLADKLEAKGEKVDRDFAGMIVWARTTTGQAIYADSVMEQIAADLAAS